MVGSLVYGLVVMRAAERVASSVAVKAVYWVGLRVVWWVPM